MIEVSVVPYKFKYLDDLSTNFDQFSTPNMGKSLPKIGFIAYFGDTPVATGFLRRIEPCYYMIDHLSATRFFGGSVADKALKAVIEQLMVECDPSAITMVITSDKATMVRAQGLGVFNESVCKIRSREDF